MARYAWVLEVRPGYEEEYRRRHDEIWPETVETLKEAGIHNYSIFRHGLTLFGYFETHAIHKGWGKGPLRTLIVMVGKTTCSRIG